MGHILIGIEFRLETLVTFFCFFASFLRLQLFVDLRLCSLFVAGGKCYTPAVLAVVTVADVAFGELYFTEIQSFIILGKK